MRLLILTIFCLLIFPIILFAQTETLTNAEIVEMSTAGLSKELIIDKINTSNAEFDVSVKGLVELKKANVSDEIISVMVEKSKAKRQRFTTTEEKGNQGFAESQPTTTNYGNPNTPAEMLKSAKTIAIKKASAQPARQNLEKALLKREGWKKFNLTITEFKETADLFIEIGFVHFSLLTHRYVFRVYDTRSGSLICAGETTSWGSLSENLAGEIVKAMTKAIDQ
jgi:hypothetical protein